MKVPFLLMRAAALAFLIVATPAEAESLRYANKGDLNSLDPHTLDETTANAHLAHVYEGLVRRGKDLRIEPGLAERWEASADGLHWRFFLRRGVKFHDGSDFTADDVMFSADRVRAPDSNHRTRIPADANFVKIDDHTVDIILKSPNPLLVSRWDTWFIMNKRWAEVNQSTQPTSVTAPSANLVSLQANGTGPFRVETHLPGIRTTFKVNREWWDRAEHNLTEIIFMPIASDATRVAALLTGEVDLIEPVPVQDIGRVNASSNARVLIGPELRTIFLGFDQLRDELLELDVAGRNPFKDRRVRQAIYQAIDIESIRDRTMRGLARPSALMIAPELFPKAKDFPRLPFDPAAARGLLVEAGYQGGFEVGMDCPNDRYVNDEAICQAVAGMLAKIGVSGAAQRSTEGKVLRQGAQIKWIPNITLPSRLDTVDDRCATYP